MDPTLDAILKILDVLVKVEPTVESAVEGWLTGRKAKRVEDVRPPHAHVDDEIEDLENGR